MDTRFTRHEMTEIKNYGDGVLKNIPHTYSVRINDDDSADITFQKGALNEPNSIPGLFHEDLILILYHRHITLHDTPFVQSNEITRESNLKMIRALEDYIGACFGRRIERVFRDVSGTHNI